MTRRLLLLSAIVTVIVALAGPQVFAGDDAWLAYTTRAVNLREGPGKDFRALRQLEAGHAIFVISTERTDGFLPVVDIETAEKGWVHGSYIQLDSVVPPNDEAVFTPEGRTSSGESELEIYNNTRHTLTLSLNETVYRLGPQERRTVAVSAGDYRYRASAPGVIPDYGAETIQDGYRYTWQFYTVMR